MKRLCWIAGALLSGNLLWGAAAPIPPPEKEITAEYHAETLGCFFLALHEEQTLERARLLMEVAGREPENAAQPLAYLFETAGTPGTAAAIAPAFFDLWSANAAILDFAVCGSRIHQLCGEKSDPRYEELAATILRKDPGGDPRRIQSYKMVAGEYFRHMREAGKYAAAATVFGQFDPGARELLAEEIWAFCEHARRVTVVQGGDPLQFVRMQESLAAELSAGGDAIVKLRDLRRRAGLLVLMNRPERASRLVWQFAVQHDMEQELLDMQVLIVLNSGDVRLLNRLLEGPLKKSGRFRTEQIAFGCCLKAGQWRLAEQHLEKIAPAKEQDRARLELAFARRDFPAAAELIRTKPAAFEQPEIQLLVCAEKLNDPKLYFEAKNMIKTDPAEDPQLANSLGYVAAVLNVDMDCAQRMVAAALEKEPENAAYLDSMAWVLYRQGKFAEARERIVKALDVRKQLFPAGFGVILEHAGDIETALKNPDAAREYYRRALLFAPDDPECDPAAIRVKMDQLSKKQ